MYICDDGHDEVCYDGRQCPACSLNQELIETIEDRNNLLEKIEKLEESS